MDLGVNHYSCRSCFRRTSGQVPCVVLLRCFVPYRSIPVLLHWVCCALFLFQVIFSFSFSFSFSYSLHFEHLLMGLPDNPPTRTTTQCAVRMCVIAKGLSCLHGLTHAARQGQLFSAHTSSILLFRCPAAVPPLLFCHAPATGRASFRSSVIIGIPPLHRLCTAIFNYCVHLLRSFVLCHDPAICCVAPFSLDTISLTLSVTTATVLTVSPLVGKQKPVVWVPLPCNTTNTLLLLLGSGLSTRIHLPPLTHFRMCSSAHRCLRF